jgi:mannose-6-phosphate isomerase-like protein (cupin superfamily)
MQAVNLADKLAQFSEYYKPRTVSEFNGHDIMVVKLKGPFSWHKHDDTDDFFLVLSGRLTIRLRDGDVHLGPGELFVVPRGSSIALWPKRRHTSCCSSPEARPTRATSRLPRNVS